jgi:hypothetical protein
MKLKDYLNRNLIIMRNNKYIFSDYRFNIEKRVEEAYLYDDNYTKEIIDEFYNDMFKTYHKSPFLENFHNTIFKYLKTGGREKNTPLGLYAIRLYKLYVNSLTIEVLNHRLVHPKLFVNDLYKHILGYDSNEKNKILESLSLHIKEILINNSLSSDVVLKKLKSDYFVSLINSLIKKSIDTNDIEFLKIIIHRAKMVIDDYRFIHKEAGIIESRINTKYFKKEIDKELGELKEKLNHLNYTPNFLKKILFINYCWVFYLKEKRIFDYNTLEIFVSIIERNITINPTDFINNYLDIIENNNHILDWSEWDWESEKRLDGIGYNLVSVEDWSRTGFVIFLIKNYPHLNNIKLELINKSVLFEYLSNNIEKRYTFNERYHSDYIKMLDISIEDWNYRVNEISNQFKKIYIREVKRDIQSAFEYNIENDFIGIKNSILEEFNNNNKLELILNYFKLFKLVDEPVNKIEKEYTINNVILNAYKGVANTDFTIGLSYKQDYFNEFLYKAKNIKPSELSHEPLKTIVTNIINQLAQKTDNTILIIISNELLRENSSIYEWSEYSNYEIPFNYIGIYQNAIIISDDSRGFEKYVLGIDLKNGLNVKVNTSSKDEKLNIELKRYKDDDITSDLVEKFKQKKDFVYHNNINEDIKLSLTAILSINQEFDINAEYVTCYNIEY